MNFISFRAKRIAYNLFVYESKFQPVFFHLNIDERPSFYHSGGNVWQLRDCDRS